MVIRVIRVIRVVRVIRVIRVIRVRADQKLRGLVRPLMPLSVILLIRFLKDFLVTRSPRLLSVDWVIRPSLVLSEYHYLLVLLVLWLMAVQGPF